MPEPTFDVAIAGSGPAGASLALRLAREGLRVALVEAQRFPRKKPCGEFLSPECVPILAELGVLDELEASGVRHVAGMRLFGAVERATGRYVDVGRASAPSAHGLAMRRERLDDAVRRAALAAGDVELFEGWRAEGVRRGACGEVLGLSIRRDGVKRELGARFTVGADGVRSSVAASLGVRRPRRGVDRLALLARYDGVALDDLADVHLERDGFTAAAPLDGGLLGVSMVAERAAYRASGLAPEAYFERRIAGRPELAARLASGQRVEAVHGTGPLSSVTSAQVFDGAALVGDAAGYVDPITGEGIWLALRGAELLAGSLVRALRTGRTDARALADYALARRRELRPHERWELLLVRALRRPRIARGLFELFARRPGLADLAVSLSGDYVPFRELRRPSVWRAALAREGAST